MELDDISCWLPPLLPFDQYVGFDRQSYRCPISNIRPRKDPHMSWVLVSPCGTTRLLAAGPAFELFNACNRHSDPDRVLFNPYLSRLAVIEELDAKAVHIQIVKYQIKGLEGEPGTTSSYWAAALAQWLDTLESHD